MLRVYAVNNIESNMYWNNVTMEIRVTLTHIPRTRMTLLYISLKYCILKPKCIVWQFGQLKPLALNYKQNTPLSFEKKNENREYHINVYFKIQSKLFNCVTN